MDIRWARTDDMDAILAVDDDSALLYAEVGLDLGLTDAHPFAIAERRRWAEATRAGRTLLAEEEGRAVGIAVLGLVDAEPYLDQLSVRRASMRRGIGRALIERARAWAGAPGLWLNTYAHLPFNRPFYERVGFVAVPESAWRPEMRAIVAGQRTALPHPELRVVMHHA